MTFKNIQNHIHSKVLTGSVQILLILSLSLTFNLKSLGIIVKKANYFIVSNDRVVQ